MNSATSLTDHGSSGISPGWYDVPLGYDIVFDAGTSSECDFLEAAWQLYGQVSGSGKRLLEPACGSGRLIREMARRGWSTYGFDCNESSLEFARQSLPTARRGFKAPVLWQDAMQDFTLPPGLQGQFHLAHCLVSSFKYILNEQEARGHLELIAKALSPGGLYLLGLHLTDYKRESFSHERWVETQGNLRVVANTRTWPAQRKTRLERLRNRLSISWVDESRAPEFLETHWHFRTYNARQLRLLLQSVPALELVACHDFHNDIHRTRKFDDSYADIILILRKKVSH